MEVLNWKFPVATFIGKTVYVASGKFCDIVKSEANQKRFQWVFDQARPWVLTGLTESLGLARVAVLKMLGVWGPLVDSATEMLVEAAYQAMKAAGTPPVVVNPHAPESVVDIHEQAEPGDTN